MSTDSSLFFADGHIIDRKTIVVPGQFNAYPDVDASRVVFRFGHQWMRHDCLTDMIRSVTHSPPLGKAYLMGRTGTIVSLGKPGRSFTTENIRGTFAETVIEDVEKYGELFRIRAIEDSVYACGQSSQVYALIHDRWTHIDKGILDPKGETLEDIDGTSFDNLYVIGLSGIMFHYNGKKWKKVDLPTNQHLSNVRCVSRDEIYVCGNRGLVVRGDGKSWAVLDSNLETNFWGMDFFDGKLYLAHQYGLVEYDGTAFTKVDLSSKHKITCYRLHSRDGLLLSVGINDILLFDGRIWSKIVWPDNKK